MHILGYDDDNGYVHIWRAFHSTSFDKENEWRTSCPQLCQGAGQQPIVSSELWSACWSGNKGARDQDNQ